MELLGDSGACFKKECHESRKAGSLKTEIYSALESGGSYLLC